MANNINNLSGKVNIPTKVATYTGLDTDTAEVIVDNVNKTIAVNVDLSDISSQFISQSELDREIEARENGDTFLGEQLNTLSNNLETEILTRRSADEEVQKDLQKEIKRASNKEAAIESSLSSTATTIRGELQAEAERAGTAEETLQANITAEATARESVDSTLQSNIDTVSGAVEDLDNSLAAVAKTGDYRNLNNKPDLSDMATETWVGEQGFATSSDISNMVTTDTDQEITGEKTFFYSNDWVYQNYATVRGDKIELSRFNSGERTSKSSLTAEALNIEGLYADLNLETNASKFNIHVDAGDGGSVPVEFRLSDINDNSYTLDLPYKNGTLSTIEDFETLTPSNQAHSVVVYDALHNISGKNLSAYSAVETTLGVYPVIIIKTSSSEILTEAQAKSYMAAQTGSTFLPVYDYDNPTYSYLIFADGSLYKPQYDSTNGLVLYKMSNPYELSTNKVTSLSGSSTDTQYPSAKAVYDNLVNVREVAEGKCKTYILSYTDTVASIKQILNQYDRNRIVDVGGNDITQAWLNGDYDNVSLDNASFNSNDNLIYALVPPKNLVFRSSTLTNKFIYVTYEEVYDILKAGDIVLVIETDVPDRWYGNSYAFYKLETSKVDISNMMTTDTAQQITAPKSFYNNIANDTLPLRIQGFANKTWGLEMDKDFGRLHFKFADVNGTNISNVIDHLVLDNSALYPAQNGGKDLGTSSFKYKDLYLSGKINFGTSITGNSNAITIANEDDAIPTILQIGKNNPYGSISISPAAGRGATLSYTGSAGNAYLLFPNVGTFSTPKTLATTDECGTQLYKHEIKLGNGTEKLIIINNSNTEITSSNIDNIIDNKDYISMYFNKGMMPDNKWSCVLVADKDGPYNRFRYYGYNGSPSAPTFALLSFTESTGYYVDTVTKL